MSIHVLDQIRANLTTKRASIAEWLFNTPNDKRRMQLGNASEADVQEHIETLDEAVEEAENGTLGACEVCHDRVEERLMEMDYTACVCLDHMNADERRTLEYEIEMAMDVQRSLLPQAPPDFPNTQIAAFSRPAQYLGGDYFDFFRFAPTPGGAPGDYGLAIADVAGHGISASLHMAAIQTLLRTFTPTTTSPAEVVAHAQRLLVHNISFTTFVTVFLAAYDPSSRRLTYTNAGHNPPLIIRAANSRGLRAIEWLGPTAPAVGLVEDAVFEQASTRLDPGDMLILYTDGLTEATGPEAQEFGPDRLAQIALDTIDQPVSFISQAIRQEVEAFIAGAALPDDATLVILRITG